VKGEHTHGKCTTKGCGNPANVSTLMLVQTFGSRVTRRKASTGMHRICWQCLNSMANSGTLPMSLRNGVYEAARLVGEPK
jgi:hypothetical protein